MKPSIEGLAIYIRSRLEKMMTATPGHVLAVNYQSCTCTVRISIPIKSTVTGEEDELIDLEDVPIVAPLGNKYGVSFPISAGDKVLIHFLQSELGEWKMSMKPLESTNGIKRYHLSNAVIHLGLYPPVEMKTIYPAGMDGENICVKGSVKIDTSLEVGGNGAGSVALARDVENLFSSLLSRLRMIPDPIPPSVAPAIPIISAALAGFTVPNLGSSTLKAK